MKRFTWEEMRKYWESHNSQRASLDLNRDPDGLDNVLHSGVPLWLNEYYARYQKMIYEELFSLLPPAGVGARALDLGCGAGRWCRFLAQRGYQVSGIDLQQELVDLNRERYPYIQFFCTFVQEFVPDKPFDLISSVTVIQHNPFSEQETIIHKLRTITNPGGHVLVLENIRDQSPHVFANSVREWQIKFKQAGFEPIAVRRYDYNFITRSYTASTRKLVSILKRLRSNNADEYSPEVFMAKNRAARKNNAVRNQLRSVNSGIKEIAVGVDGILEPMLVRSNLALPTVHAGFLFKAR